MALLAAASAVGALAGGSKLFGSKKRRRPKLPPLLSGSMIESLWQEASKRTPGGLTPEQRSALFARLDASGRIATANATRGVLARFGSTSSPGFARRAGTAQAAGRAITASKIADIDIVESQRAEQRRQQRFSNRGNVTQLAAAYDRMRANFALGASSIGSQNELRAAQTQGQNIRNIQSGLNLFGNTQQALDTFFGPGEGVAQGRTPNPRPRQVDFSQSLYDLPSLPSRF